MTVKICLELKFDHDLTYSIVDTFLEDNLIYILKRNDNLWNTSVEASWIRVGSW